MPATAKMTGGVSIEKHVLPMSPPCSITALARIALSLKEAGKSRDAAEVTKAVEEIARLRTLRSLAWNLKDKPSGVERDRDPVEDKGVEEAAAQLIEDETAALKRADSTERVKKAAKAMVQQIVRSAKATTIPQGRT